MFLPVSWRVGQRGRERREILNIMQCSGRPQKGILEFLHKLSNKGKGAIRRHYYDHNSFRKSRDMRDWINTNSEHVKEEGGQQIIWKRWNSPAVWLHSSLSLTCSMTFTHTCCGVTSFCIICINSSSVQIKPFWFIALDTAMFVELKHVWKIFVRQKIKTLLWV